MTKEINSLVLAYLGDTIYEDYVRIYLIQSGIANVNDLQTESMKIVCSPCYGTEDVAVCRTCDWIDKYCHKCQANKLYWY